VDIFDREAVFIERVLGPLVHQFPNLRVVMEHITTQQVRLALTLDPSTADPSTHDVKQRL